ncbi:MAG TPA: helix-turn-helix domain-containing protein [Solirubrobacterales bacterium]|nr:helix-turn-helix domain-containing protein [Solirubrobacterales bacterium]
MNVIDSGVDGTRVTTLGQLCADLGSSLVDLAVAPQGLEVQINGVRFHDPLQPVTRESAAGRLLLAVGLSAERDAPGPFMRALAAARVAAVACRDGGSYSGDLTRAAEAAGVALLVVPAHVDWGELYELAQAAIDVDRLEPGGAPGDERSGLHDLFALADATAAVAGGPVTIDDMQSRVLAFSGIASQDKLDQPRMETILNRRVPEQVKKEMRDRGVIEHLLTSEEVLHVELAKPHTQTRRVIAIRLGASVLGSIWLAGNDDTLSPDADEALRRAASIAALQMTRQRIGVSIERRTVESRLAALLREGDQTGSAIERLGLHGDEPLIVLALDATARSASTPAPIGPRLIDLLAMHLHSYERPAAATSLGGPGAEPLTERVHVLTTSRGPQDRESLRQIAETCIAHATKALGAELRAGIGYEVAGPEALPVARRSAEECLALSAPGAPVTVFEEVANRSLLAEVEELMKQRVAGPSPAYSRLVEYDAESGGEYLRTLRCVLDTFGNPMEVARQLNIHVNTVRYRVKRITEITGVDLDDAEARLALELEVRARAGAA